MKKNLAALVGIYVVCLALVSLLWQRPLVLAGGYGLLSLAMLYKWHTRGDLAFYFVAFVLGPAGEMVAIRFGAWRYAEPFYLIPLWLPLLWGIAALFGKRIVEALLTTR